MEQGRTRRAMRGEEDEESLRAEECPKSGATGASPLQYSPVESLQLNVPAFHADESTNRPHKVQYKISETPSLHI